MADNITSLKKKISQLQKSYDNALLDLKKVKLDAQEERLKYERRVFEMHQKIVNFESILGKIEHKVSLTRADFDAICVEEKNLVEKIARLKKEIAERKAVEDKKE